MVTCSLYLALFACGCRRRVPGRRRDKATRTAIVPNPYSFVLDNGLATATHRIRSRICTSNKTVKAWETLCRRYKAAPSPREDSPSFILHRPRGCLLSPGPIELDALFLAYHVHSLSSYHWCRHTTHFCSFNFSPGPRTPRRSRHHELSQ